MAKLTLGKRIMILREDLRTCAGFTVSVHNFDKEIFEQLRVMKMEYNRKYNSVCFNFTKDFT